MSAWPKVPLRQVVRVRSEIIHPRDKPQGRARFVGLEHIESHTGRRIGELSIQLEDLTGRKARFLPGDIVYGYLRPYLNKVWVADFEGYCSVDQYVLQVDETVGDPKFVSHFMRSDAYLSVAPIDATPGQLPRIRIDEVLSVPFPRPTIDEQRRIAEALDRELASAEAARGAAAVRHLWAGSLRRRAYELAFADCVPLSAVRTVVITPVGWTWHTLTDLARLETGHTPSRNRPDWWTGDVPWIALSDIRRLDGKVAAVTTETTNADGIANSSARILPTDTVVMSRTASVGFVTRMGRPMATSQDFVNWVCGPDLDPEFLMHLLIRSRNEIRTLSSGAIHKTVYLPTVRAFRVCVPAIDEQRRIAAELTGRLAAIDAMDSLIQAEREAIDALHAALLRRAFQDLAA
jgi:type I restriction enzyme S subunit